MQQFSKKITQYIYIILLCILCNWMLLMNDGFYWDDNIYYYLIKNKHYEEFTDFMMETGLPLNILFFRGLDLLVGIEKHRWISFATILASSFLVKKIFESCTKESEKISQIFVLLYISLYPFKSTVLLCTTVYQVMVMFFLMAIFIRRTTFEHSSNWIRSIGTCLFGLLSFISFDTASILLLYYFYIAFEYRENIEIRNSNLFDVNVFKSYIKKNFVLILLPLIYWIIKNIIFPTHGEYIGYNKIKLDLLEIVNSLMAFVRSIFFDTALTNISKIYHSYYYWVAIVCISLMAWPNVLKCMDAGSTEKCSIGVRNVLWSILFLFITALPYALIHLRPSYRGFESRHLILVTLSLPIFLLYLLFYVFEKIKKNATILNIEYISRPIIFCIVMSGIVASNILYIDYQAIAIKQWSVIENLKLRGDLKQYSEFVVSDYVGDFSNSGFVGDEAAHQEWYEWVSIFSKAWGAQKWYGYNTGRNVNFIESARYGTLDIDKNGRRCELKLFKTTNMSKGSVVAGYWREKYFGDEAGVRQYLLSISTIQGCSKKI